MISKNSLQNSLKSNVHYSTDLVSLDFKSQSLNKFLQNVVSIVNQHSHKLNQLQSNKINIQTVRTANIQLFNASKLPPIIVQQLPHVNVSQKHENFKDTIQGLSAHLTQHSHGFQYLLDLIKKQNNKIQNLNDSLSTFETAQNSKESLKKMQSQSKKFTEDQLAKISNRLKDLEMNTSKKLNNFENLTKQIQKKTLWKITQCEEALMKKITPEYVDKAFEQFENQIIFKIEQGKNQQLNELKYMTESLKNKVDVMSKEAQQNEKENKKMLKQLQQAVKNFQHKEKIEKDFKQVESKFKEMLIKIDKLQKREHPQDLEFRIMKVTSEHEQKLNAHQQKIKKLDNQLSSINNIMSSMGGGSGGFGIDPHKLCQLDGEIRQCRDGLRTTSGKLNSVEQQLKTKLMIFEQRIMTTLSMIKGQDHFVSRQEMYESISRLRDPINQRLVEYQNLINELNGKTNKLEMFEKYTKKKIKQMTKGDELNKILDLKMNIGQAQSHFSATNMKLQALEIIMNKIKMELQSNSDFLRMLQKEINEPEEGINVLIPKTKVFPAKCIPCGTKHVPTFENNMMQGSDGKLYKVDLKSYHQSDMRQVYSVTQNQLAIFDSPTKASTVKTRPTSGKTINIRTTSSKYF